MTNKPCFSHWRDRSISRSRLHRWGGLLLAIGWLSIAVYGCSQPNAKSPEAKSDSARAGNTAAGASNVSSPTAQSSTNTTTASSIRIGYQRGGVIPVARQRGELDKDLAAQKITVEWSGPFDRCASLLQAIMGGRTDIGGCGDIPAISALAAGQPLCIGAIQPPKADALGNAILVRGNSTIQKPADLLGKKVAVNKGGAGEYLLLKTLEKENIPKQQVERVYLNPSDAGTALNQGNVDAWAVWEPYISVAQLEHAARRITTTHPSPTYNVLMVGTDAAKKRPAAVKAALDGLAKNADWLNQNTDKAAEFMVKELKVSAAVAQQATKNRGPEEITYPTANDITKLQSTADWLLAEKVIEKRVDIAASVCPLQVVSK